MVRRVDEEEATSREREARTHASKISSMASNQNQPNDAQQPGRQHPQPIPVQLNATVPLPIQQLNAHGGRPAQAVHYPPGYVGTHVRTEQSRRELDAAMAVRELQSFKRRKSIYKLPEVSHRSDILPQSKLFAQLQDAERKVDGEIRRRRNEILEMYGVAKPLTEEELSLVGAARRVVRVYVFGQRNEREDTWSLTIHGRVLIAECAVDGMHPGGGGSTAANLHTKLVMFTQCLKSLRVELLGGGGNGDGNENQDGDRQRASAPTETILWEKCKQDRDLEHQKSEKDSRFQIVRKGGCPDRVRLTFDVDHVKSMYSVPERLEKALGLPSGLGTGLYSIAYITGHVWNHAKKNGLLVQVGEVGKMKLDGVLTELVSMSYEAQGKVFHAEEDQYMSYAALSKCVATLLTPAAPFTVEYSMENPDPYKPLCFDFHYESPLISTSAPPAPPDMVEARSMHHAEMDELDVDLAELYHKLCETEAAHAILQSFATDPHRTMREILSMHNKEPRVAAGPVTHGNEDAIEIMSQSAPYRDPWVDEAILKYLSDAKAELEEKKRMDEEARRREQGGGGGAVQAIRLPALGQGQGQGQGHMGQTAGSLIGAVLARNPHIGM